jgi:hypothetical protein
MSPIPSRQKLLQAIAAVLVLAYALRYLFPSLSAGFASDDPMNIRYYWNHGLWQTVLHIPVYFTTFQRPVGGLFYLILFKLFHLNPWPYHLALIGLLLLNCWLFIRFARLLTGSAVVAALAALPVTFHPRSAQLAYMPSYVFDVLCFTFFILTLDYYMRARAGGPLTRRQTAVLLVLQTVAFGAKEMAVTMPVLLLICELFFYKLDRRSILPLLLSFAATLPAVLGKAFGSDTLLNIAPYQPVFTAGRFFEFSLRFITDFLIRLSPPRWPLLLLLALAALLPAVFLRRPALRWLCFAVVIVPLPIAFLPARDGGALYLPIAFCSLLAACLAAEFMQSPWLRRVPPAILVVPLACYFIMHVERDNHRVSPMLKGFNQPTVEVIAQIQAIQPSVPPGSAIYIANDPYSGWDAQFLFELQYADPTVRVHLGRHVPLEPEKIALMDYVFTFEGNRLLRIRGSR